MIVILFTIEWARAFIVQVLAQLFMLRTFQQYTVLSFILYQLKINRKQYDMHNKAYIFLFRGWMPNPRLMGSIVSQDYKFYAQQKVLC